eukprot:jgi/Tetstr1/426036/TSEL_016382.t1
MQGHIFPPRQAKLSHRHQRQIQSVSPIKPSCRLAFRIQTLQRTMDRWRRQRRRLQETALAARPVTRTLRLHPFSPLPSHRARQAPQGHYHNQGH